jgi:parallel beta-helix repeat protein
MKLNQKSPVISLQLFFIAALLMISGFTFVSLNGGADGSGDYPPPSQGDWIITQETLIQNDNITVAGNVTIENNGKLTLDSTTLMMNTPYYGGALITVKDGGELNIINNSQIIEGITEMNYDFIYEKGSSGVIRESTISNCGWDDGGTDQSTGGMIIQSDDVTIENSTLTYNWVGIVVIDSSPEIKYNEIFDNHKFGIFIYNGTPQLLENEIYINPVGISSYYSDFTLTENTIRDNGDGGRFYFSDVYFQGGVVSSNDPDDCSTGECSATESGKGIKVFFSNLSIDDAVLSRNSGGLIGEYSYIHITNSTISENYDNGILGKYSDIDLEDNTFSDNEEYGILWRYSQLDIGDNNVFFNNNGAGRVRQEWSVLVHVTDSSGDGVAQATVDMDGNGRISSTSKITDPSGFNSFDAPEYETANDGSRIVHNSFTITASKTAPWNDVSYSNSETLEIIDNTQVNISIPLVKPDIQVQDISFSETPKANKEIKIKIELANTGLTPAKDVEIIIIQKDSLGKNSKVNSTFVSFTSNENKIVSISWTPELEGETTLTVTAKTNYDEINLDNNELVKTVDVQKNVPFFQEPYFIAALVSIMIILMGITFYILILKKKTAKE